MTYGGGMNELPYPSDLTAAQWALIGQCCNFTGSP
jgi:hypothetical protein